jgi:hypothetical protein
VLILFDHGTPNGLIRALPGHTVHTAQAKGWDTLSNGALLNAAEEAGFELLLTTDRRIRYQQNLRGRVVAAAGRRPFRGVVDTLIAIYVDYLALYVIISLK